MAVYVDDMKAGFGRMTMCHMIADTPEELRAMARKIRVQQKWIQDKGTYKEHFDICLSKRKLAVKHGAKQITFMELGRIVWGRRPYPSGIYRITHKPSGRVYIGSAYNLVARMQEHKLALASGTHGNRKLQEAWFHDGKKAFSFQVIKRCPLEDLLRLEQKFIDKYDAVNTGFNIAPEAGKVTFGKSYHLRSKAKKQGKNRPY